MHSDASLHRSVVHVEYQTVGKTEISPSIEASQQCLERED